MSNTANGRAPPISPQVLSYKYFCILCFDVNLLLNQHLILFFSDPPPLGYQSSHCLQSPINGSTQGLVTLPLSTVVNLGFNQQLWVKTVQKHFFFSWFEGTLSCSIHCGISLHEQALLKTHICMDSPLPSVDSPGIFLL